MFKEGQKVFDKDIGEGFVYHVDSDLTYGVWVYFYDGCQNSYTKQGKKTPRQEIPSLVPIVEGKVRLTKEKVMFKVGQKVWCAMFGEGKVVKILTIDHHFPVVVDFDGKLESYTLDGKYCTWAAQMLFPYPVEIVKKVVKPSINWEHVDSKFNYLAEDSNGAVFLYEEKPFTAKEVWANRGDSSEAAEAHMFTSYTQGTCNWKDSLVKRPD